MIKGVGVDLVAVSRMERLLVRHREAFLRRLLSDAEKIESTSLAETAETSARRFALKEAVAKSLGLGIFALPLREIGVGFENDGRVRLIPSEKLAAVLSMRQIGRVFLDTARAGDFILALAVLEGEEK